MEKFLLSERYRLEIHWKDLVYKEEICLLKGACFSGPALSLANEINSEDSILLDFYSQYIKFVSGVYVGKFSWGEVEYKNNDVLLHNAKLIHEELSSVPKLKNDDYLVIDTLNHEEAIHAYNPMYKTYVVNKEIGCYNFNN